MQRLRKLRKLCMLILEKSDKTRYNILGFLKWSPFLYPSPFSNPLTTLSKTDSNELHTLVSNVFVGLVIKVTFALRERSRRNRENMLYRFVVSFLYTLGLFLYFMPLPTLFFAFIDHYAFFGRVQNDLPSL